MQLIICWFIFLLAFTSPRVVEGSPSPWASDINSSCNQRGDAAISNAFSYSIRGGLRMTNDINICQNQNWFNFNFCSPLVWINMNKPDFESSWYVIVDILRSIRSRISGRWFYSLTWWTKEFQGNTRSPSKATTANFPTTTNIISSCRFLTMSLFFSRNNSLCTERWISNMDKKTTSQGTLEGLEKKTLAVPKGSIISSTAWFATCSWPWALPLGLHLF